MKSESQTTLPTTIESGKESPEDMSEGLIAGHIPLSDGPLVDGLTTSPDAQMCNDDVPFELPSSDRVVPGVVGLQNIGNTCFMNSTLQCLLHCQPLCEYFLSGQYKDEINESNVLGTGGKLAKEFAKLVDMIWNDPFEKVITPRELKWVIGQHAPMFGGYQQQDSQELVTFLLDGLHEDLNLVKEKSYTEVIEANDRPDELVAQLCWDQHLLRNRSRIVDLFQGQYKSRLQCPDCGKCSVTFDPFMYLSLPIPSRPDLSILVTFTCAQSDALLQPIRLAVNVFRDSADLTQAIQAAVAAELPEEYSESIIADDIAVFSHSTTQRCFQQIEGSNFYATSSLASKRKVFCTFAPRTCSVPSLKRPRNNTIFVTVQARIFSESDPYTSVTAVGAPTALAVCKDVAGRDMFGEVQKALEHQLGARSSLVRDGLKKATIKLSSDNDEGCCGKCALEESQFGSLWETISEENKTRMSFQVEIPVNKNHHQTDSDNEEEPVSAWEETVGLVQSRIADNYRVEESWKSASVMSGGHRSCLSPVSLGDCFSLFSTEEVLGAEDQWYCSACKAHVRASKKIDLWKLPQVLIIHLKRFQYARGFRNKIESVIDFPSKKDELLDLSAHVKGGDASQPPVFRLFAISNHMGSLYSGHYTAFAKRSFQPDDEDWYSFNDAFVHRMESEPDPDSSAYLLFYHRAAA